MRKFASKSGTDTTLWLKDKDGKFYVGNKEAKLKENNIIVGDREYAGTPELWELIVATTPDDKMFTIGIMIIMLKVKQWRKWNLTESQQKLEMEAHIKTNWGRKGSVYRKRSNTFGSNNHFTVWHYCTRRKSKYTDDK